MKKQPLSGKRIVVTRSANQAGPLKQQLEAQGAEVVELPLIQTSFSCVKEDVVDVFAEMSSYEWIIFTSTNGVRYFFELFFKTFKDIRSLGGMRIACIGKSTAAEIEKFHLQVDVLPKVAVSEALFDAMMEFETLDNRKMLLIKGNLNKDTLIDKLEHEGRAIVDALQVYKTEFLDLKKSKAAKEFREQGADAVIFTSASSADSFKAQGGYLKIGKKGKLPKFCSIGPVTSEAMRKNELPVDMEAKEHSIEGVVKAVGKYFE